MPIKILMPALSPTMTEGNLVKWVKKEGDSLSSGDVIAEIETDKATMEVEAVDDGILAQILVSEGTVSVPVNSVIALILEEGETKEDLKKISLDTAPATNLPESLVKEPSFSESPSSCLVSSQKNGPSERIFSSPLARRIAQEKNIPLSHIQGSGPRGRIVKKDVETLSSSQKIGSSSQTSSCGLEKKAKEPYEDIPLTSMRKVVAKRLTESKQTIPHFYVSLDVEIDALLSARKELNETFKDQKISVNDFLILACGKALREVPDANASWMETHIRRYTSADISVAVSIEGGLITPIIRDADCKTLPAISSEMKSLREKAQQGKLAPHEFQGGSFSISNMGMYGVTSFSAILNPPQGCILAVGSAQKKAVVRNDAFAIATLMNLTLSVDHRVIDGAVAAEFLQVLKRLIESPVLLFV